MFSCATQARLRVYDSDGKVSGEKCLDLDSNTTLASLFQGKALSLPGVAARPSAVELAVYGSGGASCPMDAPFVALGRSATVDLLSASSVDIPLGCVAVCQNRLSNLTPQVFSFEDGSPVALGDATIGQLTNYDSMLSTQGTCATPTIYHPRAVFQPLTVTDRTPQTLQGDFPSLATNMSLDNTSPWVCAALRYDDHTFGCLVNAFSPTAWKPSAALTQALLATVQPDAHAGLFVVRAVDAMDNPIAGVKLYYAFNQPNMFEGEYWDGTTLQKSGGTVAGLGIAVFRDAPAGICSLDQNVQHGAYLPCGAADRPDSITVVQQQIY
jgi:hypothetical protein